MLWISQSKLSLKKKHTVFRALWTRSKSVTCPQHRVFPSSVSVFAGYPRAFLGNQVNYSGVAELISWMPNFKPKGNVNTIIELSGGGEGGGEEWFKKGNLNTALVPRQHPHSNNQLARLASLNSQRFDACWTPLGKYAYSPEIICMINCFLGFYPENQF